MLFVTLVPHVAETATNRMRTTKTLASVKVFGRRKKDERHRKKMKYIQRTFRAAPKG